MNSSLRPARPGDADRIVELSLAAWAPVFDSFREILGDALYRRIHPDWRRDQATSVRDAIGSHDTWVAVDGEPDGTVVGFVNVTFDEGERTGEIYMIAVDPAAQRRGIATALTGLALDEMRRRGIDVAVVATGGDPGHAPARALYEKFGFDPLQLVRYYRRL